MKVGVGNILFNEHSDFPGSYSGFRWQGWLNGGKNQNPKISLGLPIKTIKIPGPKINPKNCQAEFPSLKKFQTALMDITGKITLNINIRNHMFVPGYAGTNNHCHPKKYYRIKNFNSHQTILWSFLSLEIQSSPTSPHPRSAFPLISHIDQKWNRRYIK